MLYLDADQGVRAEIIMPFALPGATWLIPREKGVQREVKSAQVKRWAKELLMLGP